MGHSKKLSFIKIWTLDGDVTLSWIVNLSESILLQELGSENRDSRWGFWNTASKHTHHYTWLTTSIPAIFSENMSELTEDSSRVIWSLALRSSFKTLLSWRCSSSLSFSESWAAKWICMNKRGETCWIFPSHLYRL